MSHVIRLKDEHGNWIPVPTIKGDKGDKGNTGDTGTGLDILGTYVTLTDLQAAVPSPAQGDMYNVGLAAPYNIYMWDETTLPGEWVDQGVLQGPAGRDGAPGTNGQDGTDGQDGAPGPNQVTTDTVTNITGIIKGEAGKTAQAVAGTDYAAASHNHTKSQITDFPASMPASDVSAWAKAAQKPAYSVTEISNITISATDLTAGSSPLATGALYFVYE